MTTVDDLVSGAGAAYSHRKGSRVCSSASMGVAIISRHWEGMA